ncbi:hypothetical protein M569_03893, partial [Genlisea aurea]
LYHPRHVDEAAAPAAILAGDVARVEFLNARLSGKRVNVSRSEEGLVDRKSVGVPLSPGASLGVGNYYTKIGIGTPASDQYVIVDTGSSFSWLQCQPCAIYCHSQVGSTFDPSSSATYRRLSCNAGECSSLTKATLNSPSCTLTNTCIYSASYGDRSFSIGYLSQDSLVFGSESLPGFVFGCGQDNNGLFGRSAGIFGLAKNELSLISQLSKRYSNAFSYCLPTASSGSGGYLSIGGGSTREYQFTPMLSDPKDSTLYFLRLTAIAVSGKALAVSGSDYSVSTIIDSGTVISRLPSTVYSTLRSELIRIISSRFRSIGAISILDACFSGTFDDISQVIPTVQMIFHGGAALNLAPANVIIEVQTGNTCLSFSGNANLNNIAIIGNQQQQTFDIVYDIDGSRIGFASGGC